MKRLFGTDGIRGRANAYPITPEVALQLGKAIAEYFGAEGHGSASVVIGKDTRLSGYMLETALTSGFVSMGMDVLQVGPMPTPAIAHLIQSFGTNCGIMITASHNPAEDNGIKLFGPDGFKLPDDVEIAIEKLMLDGEIASSHIETMELGKAYRIEDARGRYIEFAKGSVKNTSLKGMKIVLDCANGAGYSIAPMIFKELGAEVVTVATDPDGVNINKGCGATVPENISDLVKKEKADVGVCLDGDADRVIMLDTSGNIINGDKLLAICAINYKEAGKLRNNTLVTTVMSNLGLIRSMENAGIKVIQTKVGDRYVIEEMRKDDYNIGGEQSGHIIFMDHVTTGDGIISALNILMIMKKSGKTLTELARCMKEYPQILSNLTVKEKIPIWDISELKAVIEKCEKTLGKNGRVLVRYSGTENLLRVMVEAADIKDAEAWVKKIMKVARQNLESV